jgi:hypothetical protein
MSDAETNANRETENLRMVEGRWVFVILENLEA